MPLAGIGHPRRGRRWAAWTTRRPTTEVCSSCSRSSCGASSTASRSAAATSTRRASCSRRSPASPWVPPSPPPSRSPTPSRRRWSTGCSPRPPACCATSCSPSSEGPALDESTMRANEDRIRRGEQQRAVYPASALSSPQGQRWMSVWGEVGEDQRILPTTDTEFAVFGESAVVALAAWDDPDAGLRRHPRPAHREALHRLLRPRLEARGPRALGRRPRGQRRPQARRAARAGPEGRGDRPLPGGQPAHRAPPGGPPDGGQRGRHPLPARLGAGPPPR